VFEENPIVFSSSPGALLFNAGCNEQVFYPKLLKKFGADLSCRFREKGTFNSEK